jgi:hypothetical protein
MDLMLRKVLFSFFIRHPEDTQCGAIWTTPQSPDDGSFSCPYLETNSVSFYFILFPLFPFCHAKALGLDWGALSSALGDRPGGEYRSSLDTGVGCVVFSLSQLNIFFFNTPDLVLFLVGRAAENVGHGI